jgi:hypothetical protein
MKKYLIDANLPSRVKVWQTGEFELIKSMISGATAKFGNMPKLII